MRPKVEQENSSPAKVSVPASALRRSKRVIVDVPLVICGESADRGPFKEKTFTVKVSAHGGLVVLENRVALGQKVLLMNPRTWNEQDGTVIFLGPPYAGLATVGVEFSQPAPEFWSLSSPPADWGLAQ